MRIPYHFNKKNAPKTQDWGMDVRDLIQEKVNYESHGLYCTSRHIEDKIDQLSTVIGGLAQTLISKGLLSPQDFLVAIGAEKEYEARENKKYDSHW